MAEVTEGKLTDFRPQDANANKHTPRGIEALDQALTEDGYVAPITVAADGEAIDGSARLDRALKQFGDRAIIVKHDGRTPIVMVREDIPNADTEAAKRIAYRANRIAQLDLEWDQDVIAADAAMQFDFAGVGFTEAEVNAIIATTAKQAEEQVKGTFTHLDKFAPKPDEESGYKPDNTVPSPTRAAPPTPPATSAQGQMPRYPLAIVLTIDQFRQWKELKTTLEVNDDKAAFLQVLEIVKNEKDAQKI